MRNYRMSLLLGGLAVLVGSALVLAVLLRAGDRAPAEGRPAPDFTLKSQEGQPVRLHDFKGKWVVLYFYPKDMTSGCTIEAHNFQRDLSKYDARNAVILGVSVQDEKSHREFCVKEGLTFKLLADTGKKVSGEYGSILNLGVAKLSARHTFLIDPSGIIRKVWMDVDVKTHSDSVLAAIDGLEKPTA